MKIYQSEAVLTMKTENIDMGLTFDQEQYAQESAKELKSLFARAGQAAKSSEDEESDDDTKSST